MRSSATPLVLLLSLTAALLGGCIDEADPSAKDTPPGDPLDAGQTVQAEQSKQMRWNGNCDPMLSVGAADSYAPAVHGVGSFVPDDRPENLTKVVVHVEWNSTTDVANQERIGLYVHYADRSFDPKASLAGTEGSGPFELVITPDIWVPGSELEMTLHASLEQPVAAQVQCFYTVTATLHWLE